MEDTKDVKPTVTIDGVDVYDIPVEEEELAVAESHDQTKIWAMKIPRFLLERWERVKQGGVPLGTLVVDNSHNPPKITLKLPSDDGPPSKRARLDTNGIPDEYEVNMPSDRAKNAFVFREDERTWVSQGGGESSASLRRREKARPTLVGSLDHEASVRPITSAKYLKILEQRRLESEQSKRPIVQLDDTKMSRAKLNQLASGFSNAASTLGKGMVPGTARVAPGERFARLDKAELTDKLFTLFSDKPYWSITALKQTVQQPDAWLREVLKDVAVLIKEGQYANMWELKDTWKDVGDAKPDVKDEMMDEDDEDDFELVEV